MVRRLGWLLLLTCGTCMEMKETVERMVMVRTTGSDLQPAATGYIYKKENDGHASLIEMGESEVMEQLSKLYEQPQAFKAPLPIAAGPFYAKEEDESKAASQHKETQVKPVVEKIEEEDGIADEDDYAKIFKDYQSDFEEYLRSLGHYKDGLYGGYDGGSDYGADGYKAYGDKDNKGYATKHHYQKGGAGDYHNEKHQSYSISKGDGHGNKYGGEEDSGKHYGQGYGFKSDDNGHKDAHVKEGEIGGFHKQFDKDEHKKDNDFFNGDAVKVGYGKYGYGHKYHGAGGRRSFEGGSQESGHDESGLGEGGQHSDGSEERGESKDSSEADEYSGHAHGGLGSKSGYSDGRSYGYKIKH